MLRRFKSSVTFLMKLLAFLLCAACFFGLFGLEYFFLLRPSRTLGVTAVAFVVVYVLMTKVYGGFDIGKRKSKPIVVCGDFNIAHKAIDLARPKQNEKNTGFLPEERAFLDRFTALGYVDTFRHVHGDVEGRYSWWSYKMRAREKNVGWRIDYFFVSEELKPYIRDAWIEDDVYGSDHCPVGLELDI